MWVVVIVKLLDRLVVFIFCPFFGVIDDVVADALKGEFVSDDVVVETGLPFEICVWKGPIDMFGAY